MSDYKPTIAVDFDGVIHSYISGWRGAHVIPDLPVEGAIEWLDGLLLRFHVVIVSTRARTWRGRRAIRRWLRDHCKNAWLEHWTHPGFESIQVTAKKVPALVYIDDRAMRFEGEFPSTDALKDYAIPWTKRGGIPIADGRIQCRRLRKECEALQRQAKDDDRALTQTIEDRDAMEDRINAISAALGLSEYERTWSSSNDVGEACVTRAQELAQQVAESGGGSTRQPISGEDRNDA